MSSVLLRRESSHRRLDHLAAARRLVAEVLERWRRGEPADARGVLREHPFLAHHPSQLVELAYEEYCRRRESGESLDMAEFCGRFPECEASLWRQLAVHDLLDQQPELEEESPWPEVGQRLAGYVLVEELGRGAFSRVFLASEEELGNRLVAIKVCRYGADEAETLGRLQHANIVQVHSVRRLAEGKLSVLCMPYLGRTTLEHVLRERRRRHPRRAADIEAVVERVDGCDTRRSSSRWRLRGSYADGVLQLAAGLAEALQYAHDCGVVHLDLKPSNVLVLSDGSPRLLDFNLCRDEDRWQPRLGGTLAYMSPEQIGVMYFGEGELGDLDGRSDVFSLALIVWELLAGESPLGGLERGEEGVPAARRRRAAQRQGPGPVSASELGVSPAVLRCLRRCLAVDPGERPASAGELAGVLRRETNWWARRRRMAWRHRLAVLVGVLSLAAAASPGVWHLATRPPYAERQLERARQLATAGHSADALPHVNRTLAADPTNPHALFLRGRLHTELGDYPAAIRDLRQVVEQTEDYRPRYLLGFCCAAAGYHRDAIAWYDSAIDANPDDPNLKLALASSLYSLARTQESKAALEDILAAGDGNADAFHLRALVALREARTNSQIPDAAVLFIERALASKKTKDARIFYDAAKIYSVAASFDGAYEAKALEYIRRAISHGVSPELMGGVPPIQSLLRRHPHLFTAEAPTHLKRFGAIADFPSHIFESN